MRQANVGYYKGNREGHDPFREKENQYQASRIEHGDSNSVRATASDQSLFIYDECRTSMQSGESSGAEKYPPNKDLQTQYEKSLENVSVKLKTLRIINTYGEVNEICSLPLIWSRNQTITDLREIQGELSSLQQLTTTDDNFLVRVNTYLSAISKALK